MHVHSARTSLARLLALLLAFVMIAAACGGSDDSDDNAADTTSDSETGSDDSSDDDADDGDSVVPTITAPEEEEVAEEEVQRGGILRVAMEADGDGINPVANNFANAASLMGGSIFDPLVAIDQNGNWFPYVAESASPVEGTTAPPQAK